MNTELHQNGIDDLAAAKKSGDDRYWNLLGQISYLINCTALELHEDQFNIMLFGKNTGSRAKGGGACSEDWKYLFQHSKSMKLAPLIDRKCYLYWDHLLKPYFEGQPLSHFVAFNHQQNVPPAGRPL